jgi:integrase
MLPYVVKTSIFVQKNNSIQVLYILAIFKGIEIVFVLVIWLILPSGDIWSSVFRISAVKILSVISNRCSHSIKDTKTHQKRFVPLVELNRATLLEHYKSSKFNKPDDFIWPNQSGGSLNESLVNHRFTQSIRKLGLRKIRLYDLSHGHITELLNDGVPDKQIQERVGHSSATMTKDRYGHFLVGAQEKSIRK